MGVILNSERLESCKARKNTRITQGGTQCWRNPGWADLEDRADSRLAPSQWETALQSNAVSYWLGANLESALRRWICTCISYLLQYWNRTGSLNSFTRKTHDVILSRYHSCWWPGNWRNQDFSRHGIDFLLLKSFVAHTRGLNSNVWSLVACTNSSGICLQVKPKFY